MVSFKGTNKKKKNGVLELSEELTINDIADAKTTFNNAITKSQILELQFKGVDRIDVAFLQLIHAMEKTAVNLKKELKLLHPLPEVVQHTVNTTGMGHLKLWQQA